MHLGFMQYSQERKGVKNAYSIHTNANRVSDIRQIHPLASRGGQCDFVT